VRPYAEGTSVPVEKSKGEIERLLSQAGAESVMSGTMPGRAVIAFEVRGRRIRFDLPLPAKEAFAERKVRGYYRTATTEQQATAWEQACRQRWRALLLVIRAKLESSASGIETLEEAFLAQIVVAGGATVGSQIIPRLNEACQTGNLPPLLGAGSAS